MITRNPLNAPGDWYIDTRCIDCGASGEVAPGLVVEHGDKCVFARQPATPEEEIAAFRAMLVCPTASVRTESKRKPPPGLFPQELAPGLYRCGYNADDSFGAHSYFARRPAGNLLVDSPRWTGAVVDFIAASGGLAHVLLSHRDDVADADKYAEHFGAKVWIHEGDGRAAPYATGILRGSAPETIAPGLVAIPVPGHTRGSVVYLLDERYLFTGDSLAWSAERGDLTAFRDACWFSWEELTRSLARLADHRFEWVLAGHGGSQSLPAEEMNRRLRGLVERMPAIRASAPA